MKEKFFHIETIPVVLYGDKTDKVYIYVHGKMGYKEEVKTYAETINEKGYQVLAFDLPEHGERKEEKRSFVPWEVVPELQAVMRYALDHWKQAALWANSIGAYFALLAYGGGTLEKALFVSPILDMERLIQDMLQWASETEETLEEKKIIPTSFGETLDWQYYQYAKKNAIFSWNCPTSILYAGRDNLTSRNTVEKFIKRFNCSLTVVEDGEHWFHTPDQLRILNDWIKEKV